MAKHTNAKNCLVVKNKIVPFKTHKAAKSYAINNPVDVVHIFASGKEAKRYIELAEMVKTGEIKDLSLQPKFTLLEKGVNWYTRNCIYRNMTKTLLIKPNRIPRNQGRCQICNTRRGEIHSEVVATQRGIPGKWVCVKCEAMLKEQTLTERLAQLLQENYEWVGDEENYIKGLELLKECREAKIIS